MVLTFIGRDCAMCNEPMVRFEPEVLDLVAALGDANKKRARENDQDEQERALVRQRANDYATGIQQLESAVAEGQVAREKALGLLKELPEELLTMILQKLSLRDLQNFALVSSEGRRLVNEVMSKVFTDGPHPLISPKDFVSLQRRVLRWVFQSTVEEKQLKTLRMLLESPYADQSEINARARRILYPGTEYTRPLNNPELQLLTSVPDSEFNKHTMTRYSARERARVANEQDRRALLNLAYEKNIKNLVPFDKKVTEAIIAMKISENEKDDLLSLLWDLNERDIHGDDLRAYVSDMYGDFFDKHLSYEVGSFPKLFRRWVVFLTLPELEPTMETYAKRILKAGHPEYLAIFYEEIFEGNFTVVDLLNTAADTILVSEDERNVDAYLDYRPMIKYLIELSGGRGREFFERIMTSAAIEGNAKTFSYILESGVIRPGFDYTDLLVKTTVGVDDGLDVVDSNVSEIVRGLLKQGRADPTYDDNLALRSLIPASMNWGEVIATLLEDERVDPSKPNNELFVDCFSVAIIHAVSDDPLDEFLVAPQAFLNDDRIDVSAKNNMVAKWIARRFESKNELDDLEEGFYEFTYDLLKHPSFTTDGLNDSELKTLESMERDYLK